MMSRPIVGTRVILPNGKHGTVIDYPTKPKHADKVFVHKDGETGCNSTTMVRVFNITPEGTSISVRCRFHDICINTFCKHRDSHSPTIGDQNCQDVFRTCGGRDSTGMILEGVCRGDFA